MLFLFAQRQSTVGLDHLLGSTAMSVHTSIVQYICNVNSTNRTDLKILSQYHGELRMVGRIATPCL